ncbi:TPA: hypothetical protein H2W70_004109 [Salmonella enterica]|nr:hypothetical protein [Salmonella enterica]HAK8195213.1 hypothetical protein [Salmonella enterica]HAK8434561.1 hypothetical protein [Salmonella enterica]HAK8462309.1 hypothetical protein [Salmonella enterica]
MKNTEKDRNHRTAWTFTELRFVEQYYGIMPTTQIAETLGRTIDAIRWVVRNHKLNLMEPYQPWTEEEKEIIRTRFAAGDNIAQIMPLLPGRTRGAIYLMKDKLDTHSTRRWSEQERQILAQYYPTEGMAVAGRLPGRTQVAIRQTVYAMKLRLLGSEIKTVQAWSREEQQRLETHQHLPLVELTALFPGRNQQSVRKARIRLEKRQKNSQR